MDIAAKQCNFPLIAAKAKGYNMVVIFYFLGGYYELPLFNIR